MPTTRKLIFILCIASLAAIGCASTGDRDHPVHFYGWRYYILGHEKYSPREAAYARCVYRNRLPDGERSGFSRQCRLLATRFPQGINSAMYASSCIMERCHKAVAHISNVLAE
jgi:hypothetical protein